MMSLATSNVVAVRSFGIGSAVGIMVDFVISLVFVPTLLSLMKPETARTPHERYLVAPMQRIAVLDRAVRGTVLAVALVLIAIAVGSGSAACTSTRTTSTSSARTIRWASRRG